MSSYDGKLLPKLVKTVRARVQERRLRLVSSTVRSAIAGPFAAATASGTLTDQHAEDLGTNRSFLYRILRSKTHIAANSSIGQVFDLASELGVPAERLLPTMRMNHQLVFLCLLEALAELKYGASSRAAWTGAATEIHEVERLARRLTHTPQPEPPGSGNDLPVADLLARDVTWIANAAGVPRSLADATCDRLLAPAHCEMREILNDFREGRLPLSMPGNRRLVDELEFALDAWNGLSRDGVSATSVHAADQRSEVHRAIAKCLDIDRYLCRPTPLTVPKDFDAFVDSSGPLTALVTRAQETSWNALVAAS